MYQAGDKVIYSAHGVCNVIGEEMQKDGKMQVRYLILEPVGQSGSRYLLPAENPAAMKKLRRILTREEVSQLLQCPQVRENCWIPEENLRKQAYRDLISSGDCTRLLAMVNTLYRHRQEQLQSGKKVHLCDDNFLRDAEKILIGEFSVVLGLDAQQTRQYIRQALMSE